MIYGFVEQRLGKSQKTVKSTIFETMHKTNLQIDALRDRHNQLLLRSTTRPSCFVCFQIELLARLWVPVDFNGWTAGSRRVCSEDDRKFQYLHGRECDLLSLDLRIGYSCLGWYALRRHCNFGSLCSFVLR